MQGALGLGFTIQDLIVSEVAKQVARREETWKKEVDALRGKVEDLESRLEERLRTKRPCEDEEEDEVECPKCGVMKSCEEFYNKRGGGVHFPCKSCKKKPRK